MSKKEMPEEAKRLFNAIFAPDREESIIEATTLFKVTDMDKFHNIVNHIQNKNGVIVITQENKVGLLAYDTICDCVPLEVEKDKVATYDGELLSTPRLLQEILPEGETVVLQGTIRFLDNDEVSTSTLLITKHNINFKHHSKKNK